MYVPVARELQPLGSRLCEADRVCCLYGPTTTQSKRYKGCAQIQIALISLCHAHAESTTSMVVLAEYEIMLYETRTAMPPKLTLTARVAHIRPPKA